jgi:hypothetical protein
VKTRDLIHTCPVEPSRDAVARLLAICEDLHERVLELEVEADRQRLRERRAARSADIASCLANGIDPD